MKIILILIFAFSLLILVIVWGGLYPVAIIDSSYILARVWSKAQEAAKNFSNAQARSAGAKPLNFDARENAEILQEIKKNTLTFLIENMILQKKGEGLIRGFERLSREKISAATGQGGDLSRAAELVYGLKLQEFQELVLLPQARRDTAREILAEGRVDFEQWFLDVKRKAKVRLMFVPYKWDGEVVR